MSRSEKLKYILKIKSTDKENPLTTLCIKNLRAHYFTRPLHSKVFIFDNIFNIDQTVFHLKITLPCNGGIKQLEKIDSKSTKVIRKDNGAFEIVLDIGTCKSSFELLREFNGVKIYLSSDKVESPKPVHKKSSYIPITIHSYKKSSINVTIPSSVSWNASHPFHGGGVSPK